jgi:ParB/RepB/Spo0J family partition protein
MNDAIVSLGTASVVKFKNVPIESILPNPRGNPRKNIRQRDIDRLCESITACGGILVPLVVFNGPTEDTYFLLDGERRLIAAKKLGLNKVPVNILPRALADDENLATMFTIHMARVPWNTMARAMALNEYLEMKPELERDRKLLRQMTGMSSYEINNAILIRMFSKETQLRAVYPEKPNGLDPSYLIELARAIQKAEELKFSEEKGRSRIIESFLNKIGRVIYDPYQFKDLRKILDTTTKTEAREIFQKLVKDPDYGIDTLVIKYADKIQGLRSLHVRVTEKTIGDALKLTSMQWNRLLISLKSLKGISLPPNGFKEIQKLMGETLEIVKSLKS